MASSPFICARCVRTLGRESRPSLLLRSARRTDSPRPTRLSVRASSSAPSSRPANPVSDIDPAIHTEARDDDRGANTSPPEGGTEQGALSRRLEQATEEALLTGGRSGRRAVLEEAGFSEELKERLLAKVQGARFGSENAAALGAARLDEAGIAGQGTRDIASAKPWTGTEEMGDAVLRMLTDAHRPLRAELRGRPRVPEPGQPVDMRLRGSGAVNPGVRVAGARERASAYAGPGGIKEGDRAGLSEREREARRREFRERFEPAARAVPATFNGLAALANERIEDAIARGQFKNIPRGRGVERDTRADNPFIDTTQYIMNKMIKRQEIVPPWIEKQQELVKAARTFRARLRNDWKRHAARTISSGGGTLQERMGRADEYARAEEVHNPRRRNVDQISVPTNVTDDPVMVRMRVEVAEEVAAEVAEAEAAAGTPIQGDRESQPQSGPGPGSEQPVLTKPFRDPTWEATERSYMELAVTNLNNITRSYNLMAPELAKKPYFNLERELNNCFADVAPLLAREIKDRASRPAKGAAGTDQRPKGLLDRFVPEGKGKAKVYESRSPHYGFKEMWKDLFS